MGIGGIGVCPRKEPQSGANAMQRKQRAASSLLWMVVMMFRLRLKSKFKVRRNARESYLVAGADCFLEDFLVLLLT